MYHSLKLSGLLLASLLAWPLLVQSAGPAEGLDAGFVNPGYEEKPAWFKNSFLDINEDIEEAADEGRRVLLYFYQDGCPYCAKLLKDNFTREDVVKQTREGFDVIAINMWGDREITGLDGNAETEKQFARGLKVNFTPTMVFLDEQGKDLVRLNGYYSPERFSHVMSYVDGHKEKEMTFRDWMLTYREPARKTLYSNASFMKPPFRLPASDRGSDKPLLVLFEKAPCNPCDDLHDDILKREESRKLMGQLDVVQIDVESDTPVLTPDGQRRRANDWANELDIKYTPSLVFFMPDGNEAFRTEAWLRTFHIQSAMDYVLSGGFETEPEFQRYLAGRADALEAQGIHVDLLD